MTDRQLLEAAAKAAMVEWRRELHTELPGLWIGEFYSGREWNPLTDDDLALRLAVKLRIRLYDQGYAQTPDGRPCVEDGGTTSDAYADTRRAIVRAAAAMATP